VTIRNRDTAEVDPGVFWPHRPGLLVVCHKCGREVGLMVHNRLEGRAADKERNQVGSGAQGAQSRAARHLVD
jgi:hypothetical protein